jgi:hypothetical protein
MPWDRPIVPLSDTVLASKAEQQYTSERMMRTTYKPPGVFHLFESYTDRHKALGVRDKSFHYISDWPSVVPQPTALTDVKTRNFGNKHFEMEVETIPTLFTDESFCDERPVVTPIDFRALLEEHEHCVDAMGQASPPPNPLPAGTIKYCDNNISFFEHRTCIRTIDLSSLPREIDNSETNKFKQVEAVHRILELDTTIPALPTSVQDVEFTKLGDGTALEIRKIVPIRFPESKWTRERGIVTPSDFRARLTEKEVSSVFAGIAADPGIPPAGVLKHEEEQLDVFNMRDIQRTIDVLSLPITITNYQTNKFKQVETVARTLELDSTVPGVPTALMDTEFTVLGDGTALEVHKSVPNVFDEHKQMRERPIVTPADFRALLTEHEVDQVLIGTAVDPFPLSPGQIRHNEEQLTVFTYRDSVRSIDTLSLPATIVNVETNRFKQVETVTRILELDTTVPATPMSTRDVEFTKLGDGTALEIHKDVPVWFDKHKWIRDRPIVTPADFRARLTEREESHEFAGTAADPGVPPAGVLHHEEEQIDVFNMRDIVRTIDTLSLPVTISNSQTNKFKQVETVNRILELDTTVPALPTGLMDVEFTKLGDGTALEIQKTIPSRFNEIRYMRERPIVTPQDFRAQLTEKETSSVFLGTAVDPGVPPAGVLRHEEQQIDVFTMKDTLRTIDTLSLPVTINNSQTNRYRQVESVARTLELDTTTPALPTALMEVEFTKLGDGTALEIHKSVPSVFPQSKWTRERPIVTPQDFRAQLTEKEVSSVFTGTAADPGVPPAGVLRHEEEQIDVFNMRDVLRTIDTLSLPVTINNSETNRFKQVVSVARTLELDTTIPAVPTALMDVEFTKLGDGTALEIHKTVSEVFNELTATIEIADLVPEIFKAVIPITSEEYVQSGTTINDPPILAVGDLFREEKRVTELTTRIRHRGRAGITYPQTKIASREVGGERFGGEVLQTVATLDTFAHVPTPLPDVGLGIVRSQVKDLGNSTWVKETQQWDTALFWPTLYDYKFDKEAQTIMTVEKQTVAAGYTPASAAYTVEDVAAIDKWHSRRTKITKNVASFNSKATALLSYRYHPFKFPGTLDYNRLITFDHREGYRRAAALLAKHTIRTWWLNRSTPPTVGNQDLGTFDIDVKEIITDTVNIPIFAPNNSTEAQTYPEVLHDAITNTLGAYYAPTTPTLTQYYFGTPSATTGSYYVCIATFPYGTGYHVGDSVTVNGQSFTIVIIGSSGEFFGAVPSPPPPSPILVTAQTNTGNFSVVGGGGSGGTAQLYRIDYTVPVAGSAWVGNERAIAAQVTQTDIPNLWKVVTESVTMR